MCTPLTDTRPEAEAVLIEGYRRMTPAQKAARVKDLTVFIQQLALSRIQARYPDATKRENKLRLASLWLDRETMIRAFDWDPEKEGC